MEQYVTTFDDISVEIKGFKELRWSLALPLRSE